MRINLYLPDDQKELYEEVKAYLQKEGKSVSQLFLECLRKYKEQEQLDNFQFWKRGIIDKIGEWVAVAVNVDESNICCFYNFSIGKINFDGSISYCPGYGDVVIDEIPIAAITLRLVKNKDDIQQVEKEIYSEFINSYQRALIRELIPYLIVVFAGKNKEIYGILLFDIAEFNKIKILNDDPDFKTKILNSFADLFDVHKLEQKKAILEQTSKKLKGKKKTQITDDDIDFDL